MLFKVSKATLLSGCLAAAHLIQPMGVSASRSFLNQSAPSVKTWQSARQDIARGIPRRSALLWAMGASCLLMAGCSWLALANSQENERKKRDERIAASLSVAVHSGLLEFGIHRSDIHVWSMWGEDEPDVAPKSLILSRYRVLGYSGELRGPVATDAEDLPTRTTVRPDPVEIVADQDLLLGIPHAFLKPEKRSSPWFVADTSLPPRENTPQPGLDSELYPAP
jgi:hypothetical protein